MYIKRNDLYFMALCENKDIIGSQCLAVYQLLKLLISLLEESNQLDNLRDNFSSLTILSDFLIDYGFSGPITEKSALGSAVQEKNDYLRKCQEVLTGNLNSKISSVLSTAVN